jgi:hypothetical protein
MSSTSVRTNGIHRQFLNVETIILGCFLGSVMVILALSARQRDVHLLHTPIEETLVVALLLTSVVAFSGFSLPTFFNHNPRLATFTLVAMSGFISLFFDSFAVILLLSTINTLPYAGQRYSHRFSDFAMRVMAAFNALTVGGAFYLGELWGLPHYIASDMANPLAGVPLMVVVFPYCLFVAYIAARWFPVDVQPVALTSQQLKGGAKLAVFLLLLIVTQDPVLVFGLLLLFTALTGRTPDLLRNTLHELGEGGMAAVGLIAIAWMIQGIPGTVEFFNDISGFWVFIFAAISSPFAGAMIAPSSDLESFYWNISLLMLGAPMFVWSSLVAIVVFRDVIEYEDIPQPMQRFKFLHRQGPIHEEIAYTLIVLPLLAGLALALILFNTLGIFVEIADLIGLSM